MLETPVLWIRMPIIWACGSVSYYVRTRTRCISISKSDLEQDFFLTGSGFLIKKMQAFVDHRTPSWFELIYDIVLITYISWSEINAHVRSDIGYLICLRHLFRSRAVTNLIFFLLFKMTISLHTCATSSELPVCILIAWFMIPPPFNTDTDSYQNPSWIQISIMVKAIGKISITVWRVYT